MSAQQEDATTSGAASSSGAAPVPAQNAIAEQLQLQRMQLNQRKAGKDKYQFWETQPVSQFNEDPSSAQVGRRGWGSSSTATGDAARILARGGPAGKRPD